MDSIDKPREHWSSRLGFIMAAAGSAIGLGTLWMFPYITGENGGGAFILTYILCTLLIGIPLFIAELILGRAAQKSAVPTFTVLDRPQTPWRIGGWLGVASSFLIMSYYSVLAGWGLNYAFMSLNQFWKGKSPQDIQQTFELLQRSADITLFWHGLFTFITIAVVYRGIKNGIEHWSKVMTSSLLVLLVLLVCYNTTLPGLQQATTFIFCPEWSKLKPSAILEALGLSFFTLSLGQGIMITYGSYMKRVEDIPKTACIIATMVIVVSQLAALAIFPIVFTFGMSPQGGSGLVFKTLPLLFSQLPGAQILSTLFFILFVFTALTSAIALVEVVVATLMDLTSLSRKQLSIYVGCALFLFGIPSALSHTNLLFGNWPELYGKTFFETISSLVSIWLLPIGGLIVCLFTGWKVNQDLLKAEFCSASQLKPLFRIWLHFVRWVCPVAIFIIILQQSGLINIDVLFKQ